MWLIIPVKNLSDAKTRLNGSLDSGERSGLYRTMLEDVLRCVVQVERLDEIALVTCDPEAALMARNFGMNVLQEPGNRGHSDAVQFGVDNLIRDGIDTMLTLPGDIPLVTPCEINSLIDAHVETNGPAFTISPSHDCKGSNAVICSPPDIFSLKFGTNSFYPHLDQARSLGISPSVVSLPGVSLDIDTPADLENFISRKSRTRTQAFLDRQKITARLLSNSPVVRPQ